MPEQATQSVVVTDIRMPFWSMVLFMIKWSVASIPAIIILAFLAGLIMGAASSFTQRLSAFQSNSQPTGFYDGVPDRCKGSQNQEKCIAEARRYAAETVEQKAIRLQALEAERNANMQQIGK